MTYGSPELFTICFLKYVSVMQTENHKVSDFDEQSEIYFIISVKLRVITLI